MAAARDILDENGPLAASLPNYESRPGQLEMADAVESALRDEHVLLCEAGTGTGKTLAYLVPAILSGKKVIISTATRALQEQIVNNDVPLLERALGRTLPVVALKGLGNYLCLRRFEEFRSSEDAESKAWQLKLGAIENWRRETDTGDASELVGLGEREELWTRVASSSDTRIGSRCPHFQECFVTRAKVAAETAQIVVVNHHLFFADLALRGAHPGRVLPDYDAVVFDEAHQLEEIATLFFGVRMPLKRLTLLGKDTERLFHLARNSALKTDAEGTRLETDAEAFFTAVAANAPSSRESRTSIEQDIFVGRTLKSYHDVDAALENIARTSELLEGRLDAEESSVETTLARALEALSRRADTAREALAAIVDGARGRVTWLEAGRSPALTSVPVESMDTLRDKLFDRVPAAVLTSATLSTASNISVSKGGDAFDFTKRRLGLTDCEAVVKELVLPSPFDFNKHSLLYVDKELPPPNATDYYDAATARISAMIEASDGGAFVLTTSHRSMREMHRRLRGTWGPLLLQGSAPKHALLSAFKRSNQSVLVATLSFWEGVDVPGDALRLVILEKVPFPAPGDPVIQARAQQMERDGENAFNGLFLPLAQMTLKQGFGRLVRSRQDKGAVALLDSRVVHKGYGQRLLAGLPEARRTTDLRTMLTWLQDTAAEAKNRLQ